MSTVTPTRGGLYELRNPYISACGFFRVVFDVLFWQNSFPFARESERLLEWLSIGAMGLA